MAICGHLYEVKLNNYNAHTTIDHDHDQLNACRDILSHTRSVLGAI